MLSAYSVNQLWKFAEWPEVSLKILIPVAFFTSIIPLFGPIFGMPNSELIPWPKWLLWGHLGAFFGQFLSPCGLRLEVEKPPSSSDE